MNPDGWRPDSNAAHFEHNSEIEADFANMPYRLTWEPAGVYREYFGDVTIAERRASFDAICGDRRFDDLCYAITDYLSVDAYEVTSIATAEIAAFHIAALTTNPRIAMAAVAVRPDILSAIDDFKRYGFTAAPYRVFPTLDDAKRWLSEFPSADSAG